MNNKFITIYIYNYIHICTCLSFKFMDRHIYIYLKKIQVVEVVFAFGLRKLHVPKVRRLIKVKKIFITVSACTKKGI